MERRSRKRRPRRPTPQAGRPQERVRTGGPEADATARREAGDTMRRGYARGRERDEALRAQLEPLAPGERPAAVTAAAALALLFAVANVLAALAGSGLGGDGADPVLVTALTTALLVVAAGGMFAARPWAVLGFMVILTLQITSLCLALMLGSISTWWQVLLALLLVAGLSLMFWKLIRALARLQMPPRPSR